MGTEENGVEIGETGIENGIKNLLNGTTINNIPGVKDLLNFTRKKKKTSMFGDEEETIPTDVALVNVETPSVQKQTIIQEKPIIIPKPLEQQHQEAVLAQIVEIDKAQEMRRVAEIRAKKKNKTEKLIAELPSEAIEVKMQEVKKEIEALKGEELPENINYIEIEEQIDTAFEDIPDKARIELSDIDIKAIPGTKDKTGYFKSKITSKDENYPEVLLQIASYVKKRTKGLLIPRKVDLRVIANTNKTQLRGSTLKLTSTTVVFKPDFEKLKVNKGTRFMISVPENYLSSKSIICYLQESRNKKILEISINDFQKNYDTFNAFIGDRIAEYYFSGYDITLKKLELRTVNNPLMDLITNIISTHEYKAKPWVDDNSHIYCVDFYSKGTDNQWLYIQVIENDIPGKYDIIAKNKVDTGWQYSVSAQSVTITALTTSLLDILSTCYGRVWDKELNLKDDFESKYYYLYDKLTHAKLKDVLVGMYDFIEAENDPDTDKNQIQDKKPKIDLVVKETLSKADIKKALKNDYDSEAIICKTKFCDFFIVSFLAYPIIGGDKRKGSEYITTDAYYEKYNVKDTREYSEREKTILKKEGEQRHYNSRIYLFQLEYSVGGKTYIYRDIKWENILTEVGIYTNNIKFPKTKF